ncbi:hypothetical protein L210DRAFT_3653954 [Boletus edulis BED1]|uniref:Uncharacterized protein n=1 Tax=Boletus edulis BED1 TaxID=1328754 RepID=A0AAD4BDM5_BOLED|nr:hypothetical protein L210DRAFT_3653954 [Boletus edulis BED1]
MKFLKKELVKFIVNEGQSLNKNEQEYIQLMKSTIHCGMQVIPQWLEGWKDRQKEKEQEQANQCTLGRRSIKP